MFSYITKLFIGLIYSTTIPSRLSLLKLRREANACEKIDELIELAFNFSFPLKFNGIKIRPYQVKEEIMELLKILKSVNPKNIVEIGTAGGGTLFLFAQVARSDALLISIDLPGGQFGGGYPAWKIPFYKSFARYATQRIELLRADSHDLNTLEKVKEILGDAQLDFLFIDGDHTYEGVKKDFEMYSPLIRKGGIIAFHDIVEHPPETCCEVSKFWNEVKQSYKYREIVKNWNQKWAGIGVLYV
ncbi:MAG: class I SAM-dependent methyltransferase [Candidatus Methanomethylicia archaeon]